MRFVERLAFAASLGVGLLKIAHQNSNRVAIAKFLVALSMVSHDDQVDVSSQALRWLTARMAATRDMIHLVATSPYATTDRQVAISPIRTKAS
jgi:hypothetical protein